MLTVDLDRLDVQPGHRVLDLGCGEGRHTFAALRRGARVVAVDTDPEALAATTATAAAVAREEGLPHGASLTTVRADGRCLPLPDCGVDRVIAAEVLEHVPADRVVMAEITRVLAPAGRVAVTVPRWWPERVCWALSEPYHTVEGGHVRIYRRSELRNKLARAGLAVRDGHHAHALHSPYWWLRCLVGVDSEPWAVRTYHRLLVWDLMRAPAVTRRTEELLDPVLGKSLVWYLDRAAVRG